MRNKMNKAELSWILYDVANSAFIMILTSTIPIYFRSLASEAGIEAAQATAIWGTTASVALLILAVLSPFLGALADYQNQKKRIFAFFLGLGLLGGFLFVFAPNWISFLIFFMIARIGWTACNVFYDSMLVDVTSDERMDMISGMGYAFGYIGSCVPFIIGIVLILFTPFGLDTVAATRISFVITVVWWLALSIPLFLNVKQNNYLMKRSHPMKHSLKRLYYTFASIKKEKKLLFFLLGYFFYIDGVYTIISMATAYGGEVGIDDTQMILALLLTQFVAFPCSILSAKIAEKIGTVRLIRFFILCYCGICVFAFGLDKAWEFWVLAFSVGICQGGIQALSRSEFGRMVPKKKSSEYFGIFDIFGKFADFFGPLLLAGCAYLFHSSKYGVLSLTLLFSLGFLFLFLSGRYAKSEANRS